jgi:hypothetical protein
MLTMTAANTNGMTYTVMEQLGIHGVEGTSRNGPVKKFPCPVTFRYYRPWERVNLLAARDANPFFHVMEAMAMFTNVNSVRFMTFYNKQMRQYSDDGITYNAFYGTRMLDHPFDQLTACVVQLRSDPNTRAAVISLWTPTDLIAASVDRACNLSMVFNTRPNGKLDMTVYNRSNDLVYGGVSGANIVHFSMFHEVVARGADIQMGDMYVVANDAHVYTDNEVWKRLGVAPEEELPNFDDMASMPIGLDFAEFMSDAYTFTKIIMDHDFPIFTNPDSFGDPFIRNVAIPMHNAWVCRKENDTKAMWHWIQRIEDDAWQIACTAWVQRRDGNE